MAKGGNKKQTTDGLTLDELQAALVNGKKLPGSDDPDSPREYVVPADDELHGTVYSDGYVKIKHGDRVAFDGHPATVHPLIAAELKERQSLEEAGESPWEPPPDLSRWDPAGVLERPAHPEPTERQVAHLRARAEMEMAGLGPRDADDGVELHLTVEPVTQDESTEAATRAMTEPEPQPATAALTITRPVIAYRKSAAEGEDTILEVERWEYDELQRVICRDTPVTLGLGGPKVGTITSRRSARGVLTATATLDSYAVVPGNLEDYDLAPVIDIHRKRMRAIFTEIALRKP